MEKDINLTYPQLIEPPPEDMQSPQVLAYLLEGKFESYFAGKPVPEPPAQQAGEEESAAEGTIAGDAVEELDQER